MSLKLDLSLYVLNRLVYHKKSLISIFYNSIIIKSLHNTDITQINKFKDIDVSDFKKYLRKTNVDFHNEVFFKFWIAPFVCFKFSNLFAKEFIKSEKKITENEIKHFLKKNNDFLEACLYLDYATNQDFCDYISGGSSKKVMPSHGDIVTFIPTAIKLDFVILHLKQFVENQPTFKVCIFLLLRDIVNKDRLTSDLGYFKNAYLEGKKLIAGIDLEDIHKRYKDELKL